MSCKNTKTMSARNKNEKQQQNAQYTKLAEEIQILIKNTMRQNNAEQQQQQQKQREQQHFVSVLNFD